MTADNSYQLVLPILWPRTLIEGRAVASRVAATSVTSLPPRMLFTNVVPLPPSPEVGVPRVSTYVSTLHRALGLN